MKKPPCTTTTYEHFEKRPYEAKDVSKWLFIVLALILSCGYVAGEYAEAETEIREIHHINAFRGHIENMAPVNINEHCQE